MAIQSNRLSYAFSSDFPPEAESQYRELLKRVFPILYGHLGPPAETFNVYIENLGEYSDSFVVVDGGRTFLTDTSFIPRLIAHEYVRSYPNDPASIQLLEEKPFQYWSSKTVNFDAIKNLRWTGAGDFWNPPSGAANRYSIAATTVQMLTRENPDFMREFLSLYYRNDSGRPGLASQPQRPRSHVGDPGPGAERLPACGLPGHTARVHT